MDPGRKPCSARYLGLCIGNRTIFVIHQNQNLNVQKTRIFQPVRDIRRKSVPIPILPRRGYLWSVSADVPIFGEPLWNFIPAPHVKILHVRSAEKILIILRNYPVRLKFHQDVDFVPPFRNLVLPPLEILTVF